MIKESRLVIQHTIKNIKMSSKLRRVQFGAMTFFAQSHTVDTCGSNGLPLTPNSISILGRSQYLKALHHSNLCSYIDIIRGKHERISVVCELHRESLADLVAAGKKWDPTQIIQILYQIVKGLAYLESHNIVHRALNPTNILIGNNREARIFNYGLYYMTGGGKLVSFPIGHPKYLAPEVLLAGPRSTQSSSCKADVWALGLIGAELCLVEAPSPPPSAGGSVAQLARSVRRVLSLLKCEGSVLERLARETATESALNALPKDLRSLLETCLKITPSDRPTPTELLQHPAFQNLQTETNAEPKLNGTIEVKNRDYVSERSLSEIYFLWQLAGGDVHAELKHPATLLDPRVVPLPMDALYQRLAHVPPESFFPLIETQEIGTWGPSCDTASLPLVIRERDTEYQLHRIILYDRLLKAWPHQQARLIREARQDVPPFFRGSVWAALLNVRGDVEGRYIALDKETPTPTDRQIEVDIPRCHQYDELLSSSVGHAKFKRILKAWVVGHPQYVYWQGIDSLCAPFLYLNFNNEAQAYACLAAFVPKYLQGFFLQDNWAVVQEYLAVFARLTAFHEPVLAAHMRSIGFVPELFAIPWFLTMFSHVFPLHKILPLWDRLLLGNSSFPLFVGVGILRHTTPRSATYRQHDGNSDQETKDKVHPDMVMSPLSVAELKAEPCPRLCGKEMLELLDPSKEKFSRPRLVIVDIRETDSFEAASFPDSINIPFRKDDEPDLTLLSVCKGKIIAVLGLVIEDASQFSELLLENSFTRVCIIHKAKGVLQQCADILVAKETLTK
ncbi:hypothetical protein B566_EDAN003534 [Ephemera danica]|nr:hypothetical protein B566_EDAN003534 [Ephemera danica]